MGLAIVVLAAGLGTRYGSLKQLAPLGPAGEALLDYTLHDAAAAGFSEAVLVVTPEIVDAMRAHLRAFAPPIATRLVDQNHATVPRATPWGTAHATLAGAEGLLSPFAVANADDAYGADALAAVAAFLRARADEAMPFGAVVGYRADATLSERGGVSRAVCRVDDDGRLLHVEEHTGVRRTRGQLVSDAAALDETTLVSMNLWGFSPAFLQLLRPTVDRFVAEHRDDELELRLPDVVGTLIASDAFDVTVLPTTSTWLGVTHAEDAREVRERLRVLATAARFATAHPPVDVTPVAHGHIHDTYIVTCGAHERIVLQRLNGDVFPDLDGLATNLERITTHLRAVAGARGSRPIVAAIVATRAGSALHVDEEGRTWRATRFVEGTRALGLDATADELRAAAHAFAELTRDLDDLGPPPLVETIPRFHDLARRQSDLATAIESDRAARAGGVRDLIDDAHRLGARLAKELTADGTGTLTARIVHNDAKLDNVLVDAATGAVACIVDLDTVMPGTVLNDFGELARTATSRAPEDETDLDAITVDLERFAALADGYIAGAGTFLLDRERDCLALAGPLLTIENGVRFLTDHLDGDVYFRVHRPDHNAQRCRAQFRLATLMLQQLDQLRAIVSAASVSSRAAS